MFVFVSLIWVMGGIPDNCILGINDLILNKKTYSFSRFLIGNSARDFYFFSIMNQSQY